MPATSVTELASIACFERLFNELIGANPKEYARIVRFQKSLKLLQHDFENINPGSVGISVWIRRPVAFYPRV